MRKEISVFFLKDVVHVYTVKAPVGKSFDKKKGTFKFSKELFEYKGLFRKSDDLPVLLGELHRFVATTVAPLRRCAVAKLSSDGKRWHLFADNGMRIIPGGNIDSQYDACLKSVAGLVHWWSGLLFYGNHCPECDRYYEEMPSDNHCSNPACASRKKWSEIEGLYMRWVAKAG